MPCVACPTVRARLSGAAGALFLAAAALAAPAAGQATAGQTPATPSYGTIPTIKYDRGALDGQWIPYGRRWALQGAPVTDRGRANLVVARLMEQSKSRHGGMAAETASTRPPVDTLVPCWSAPPGAAADTATFKVVLPPTVIGQTYRLSLWFFRQPDSVFLSQAIDMAYERGAVLAGRESPSIDSIDAIVNNSVEAAIKARVGAAAVQVQTPQQGVCRRVVGPPRARVAPGTYQAVVDAVHGRVEADSAAERVHAQLVKARSIVQDSAPTLFQDAAAELRRVPLATLSDADVSAVVAAVRAGRVPSDASVIDRAGEAAGGCVAIPPLTAGDCATLARVVDLFERDRKASGAAQEALADSIRAVPGGWGEFPQDLHEGVSARNLAGLKVADVRETLSNALPQLQLPSFGLVARLDTATSGARCVYGSGKPHESRLTRAECDRLRQLAVLLLSAANAAVQQSAAKNRADAARKLFHASMENAYEGMGTSELTASAWDDAQSTSDKFRIGTAYGYGAASLGGLGHGARGAAIGMLLLKFYRWPVDKSLPDPYYARWCSRFSLGFGALYKTDLSFLGQALDKPFASLYPVATLSYDLTRDLAAQLGLVGFNQATTRPLGVGSSFHTAPLLALAFDADVINRIASLLGNR